MTQTAPIKVTGILNVLATAVSGTQPILDDSSSYRTFFDLEISRMSVRNSSKTLLMTFGTALALSACGGGADRGASPGEGAAFMP